MSLFKIHILSDAAVQHLKDAGHAVETFAMNELDKAVIAAKSTEIGTAAINAVHAVEQPGVSGPEKLANAIAAVAPVVLSYAAKGGFAGVLADVESFARSVIESTLADVKQTGAVKVASAVLSLAKAV